MDTRNPKDVDFSIDNPDRFENDCECEISPVGLNGWSIKLCQVSSYAEQTNDRGDRIGLTKILEDHVIYTKRNMVISIKKVGGEIWILTQFAKNQHGENIVSGPYIYNESEKTRARCKLVKLMRV
jgi:hypothetical protein